MAAVLHGLHRLGTLADGTLLLGIQRQKFGRTTLLGWRGPSGLPFVDGECTDWCRVDQWSATQCYLCVSTWSPTPQRTVEKKRLSLSDCRAARLSCARSNSPGPPARPGIARASISLSPGIGACGWRSSDGLDHCVIASSREGLHRRVRSGGHVPISGWSAWRHPQSGRVWRPPRPGWLFRGPDWMPITPKRGSFLHADSHGVEQ
jgi:hypothetical protein